MPEAEDMIAAGGADELQFEQRKVDLALQLTEQYKGLLAQWSWGDSVLEWIRQCEITFESEDVLRKLLPPDVWPHASRASFVTLLMEKGISTHGVALECAVGMRLAFRQPPPIDCVSSQFLLYLNSTIANTAYQTWAHLVPQVDRVSSQCLLYLNSTIANTAYQTWSHLVPQAEGLFPPERFHFDVWSVG